MTAALSPAPPARGLGYIPDRPDPRDKHVGELVAVRGTRYEPNQRPFRTTRLLQGRAGACFAFALARAIHTNLQLVHGAVEPPIPSPDFLYWNGRAQAYKDVPEALRPKKLPDVGTRPREGMGAVRTLGFAAWADAPYDARDVGTRPPRDAYFGAYDQRALTYYRIDDSNRLRDIERAMRVGASIIFCLQVDTAFLWNRGEVIDRIDPGRVEGGHAVTLLDLTRGTVDFDNWWEDWGEPTERWEDDGIGRFSLDFVDTSPAVMDVYAVLSAPLYRQGAT